MTKAIFVFGEDAVSAVEHHEPIKNVQSLGNVEVVSFNTEAEMAAYRQGIADMDGWMAVMELEESSLEQYEKNRIEAEKEECSQ